MKFGHYLAIAAFFTVLSAAGCGGGGSTSPAPTQAVLKLATNPLQPYTTLGGVNVRIGLPAGTNLAMNNTVPQSGVITPIGVVQGSGQVQFLSYTAPTISTAGAVKFMVVTPFGDMTFKDGDFAQVVCGFSATAPAKSSFVLTLAATSAGGNTATANESFTLTLQ